MITLRGREGVGDRGDEMKDRDPQTVEVPGVCSP